MRQLLKRLRTRSFDRVFRRIYTIAKRYGLTSTRYVEAVKTFVHDTSGLGIRPTFPVTADLLRKHGSIIKEIQDLGAEFAVHGYRHIDYSLTSAETFRDHLEQARELFSRHGIIHSGFRFPYLKKSAEHLGLLAECGFSWESSEVISWDVIEKERHSPLQWNNYQRILETYGAAGYEEHMSIPSFQHGLIEIPVAVPDDDIIIERLECSDDDTIYRYWNTMFESIREHQECLVLQLHPERFFIFRRPLFRILKNAAEQHDIWIASLGEMADWWRRRKQFRPLFTRTDNGLVEVRYPLDGMLTVYWMHADETDFRGTEKNGECLCTLPGSVLPVIGLAKNAESNAGLTAFLDAEGYIYESAKRNEMYAVTFDNVDMRDEGAVRERLVNTRSPLMKAGRWPAGHQAALAVTGDIDCIDIFDFFNRMIG